MKLEAYKNDKLLYMTYTAIDINDRIKVIKPSVGHSGLLGMKLRV